MLETMLCLTRGIVLPESGLYSPSDPDDKRQFGFSRHIVVSHFASGTGQADLTPVHLPVLLVVALSPFVDQFPGHFAGLRTQRGYISSQWERDRFSHKLNTRVKHRFSQQTVLQACALPFSRPASSWHAWPSWWRRPFAFSKGSQGPPELFCCFSRKLAIFVRKSRFS